MRRLFLPLFCLGLLLKPVGCLHAQGATFEGLRWDFSGEQAERYLVSLGYRPAFDMVGRRLEQTATTPELRVFTRPENGAGGVFQSVDYKVSAGRVIAVHYALRASSSAVEQRKSALVAELDRGLGVHQAHPRHPEIVAWTSGPNVVALRIEPVEGAAVLHLYYYAPGVREPF